MTPPINSVSPERLDELARWAASEEAECLQDDMPISAGYYADIIKLIAARRAANTPVGPELWGKYPDTGVWHQIADGTNTDEQVADFERCYAEAGWTELRRSNPFASPALPSKVGVNGLVDYLWQEICELPDRTSPEEYPDMGMVTLKELTAIIETWAERACLTSPAAELVAWQGKTWFELREPGCVPQRTGPIPATEVAAFLREVFEHRPHAYVTVITIGYDGPSLQDGPECLQMLDGRSMSTGRKHIASSSAAHQGHPAPSASREVTERIRAILDHPSGSPEHDLGAIRAALLAALPEREG